MQPVETTYLALARDLLEAHPERFAPPPPMAPRLVSLPRRHPRRPIAECQLTLPLRPTIAR